MYLLVILFDISNFSVTPPVDVDFRLYQEISCVLFDLIFFYFGPKTLDYLGLKTTIV